MNGARKAFTMLSMVSIIDNLLVIWVLVLMSLLILLTKWESKLYSSVKLWTSNCWSCDSL